MDLRSELLSRLLIIPAILIGFTVHEYAHAIVADKLGDKTPRFQGRLTLNPIPHIDIFGFIMILFVGFGWAKPIETNPRAYKNYYKDDLKVTLAGPLANLLAALVFGLFYSIFSRFIITTTISNNLKAILLSMIIQIVTINCMLFLFNLIPIPGLDGFHILRDLSPKTFYNISDTLYRYQMIIIILIIFPIGGTSIAQIIIGRPMIILTNLFTSII